MVKRHVFRPTAFDALEDRLVPSPLSAAISFTAVRGAQHPARPHPARGVDLAGIESRINQAFASTSGDIQRAIAATDFTPVQPSPPFFTTSNPALDNLSAVILQRVSVLNQQIATILAPVPRASKGLLPQVQNQILGLGADSLAVGLNAALTSSSSFPFSPFSTPIAHSYSVQAGNLIAASRLATVAEVDLFVSASGPGARHFSRRSSLSESLQLAQIPNLITQAFSSFGNDFQSAFNSFGISRFDQPIFFVGSTPPLPPVSVLGDFKAATLQRLGPLSLELGNILKAVPGTARVGLLTLVQDQIIGPDPGSLLRTIASTLDTISTSPNTSTPGPFAPPSSSLEALASTNSLIATAQGHILDELNLVETALIAKPARASGR
jgi:hypothetical protein